MAGRTGGTVDHILFPMSRPSESSPSPAQPHGRSPLFLVGGAVLVGLALALLLFGGGWLDDESSTDGQSALFTQLPAQSGDARVAQLPASSGKLLAVGDTAYNFFLSDLEGNVVNLESFRGQPVIVNFWATWCAPCRLEMPALQAAYDSHQDDGLVVLAINDQESHQDVSEFIAELGLTITPLLDTEGQIARLYNVYNFPTTYFIDDAGRVTAVHRGLLTDEQIEEYLAVTLGNRS